MPYETLWVLVCRVIRFILARLIIDSNRWLLISYKQWLSSSAVFASNIYETIVETWRWKKILWTVKVGRFLMMILVLILFRMFYIPILLIIILLLINLNQLTTA